MTSLLVYDLETSGLSPFDQVLQYAAIRLDADTLEEIDREEIEVSWREDMIPSAEAFLVHQIPLKGRLNTCSEATALVKIHQSLNTPNTLSGGYNTLGFDDEMLRFSFYRTLLTPYTHQYRDGCGRFDLLPITLFYYLFAEDTLKWPTKPDGSPSFKLEDISRENGWAKGRAHDAMNDVLATVALLKHFRLNKPMWDYLMGYFDKQEDQHRINQLMKQPSLYQGVGIMIGLRFGAGCRYMAPVLHIGPHHIYKNQSVFIRLDLPISDLSESSIDRLIIKKKLAEPGFVLPYVDKYTEKLPKDVLKVVENNLTLLRDHDQDALMQHCRHQAYSPLEGVDLDAALYQQAFQTQEEQTWCEKFHMSGENARAELLKQQTNMVLKQQALRFLYRFHPEQIPAEFQKEAQETMDAFMSKAVDFRNKQRLSKEEAVLEAKAALLRADNPAIIKGLNDILTFLGEKG